MRAWRNTTLGNVLELKRGYDLPNAKRIPGEIPVISSSGTRYFHAEAKVDGPGVITGRYGTIGQVFFTQGAFWPLNTALYVRDFKGNDPQFCYYFLKTLNWNKFSDKSSVPGVNRNDAHQEPVSIPPQFEQQEIAAVLGALDDKIEVNRKTAATLEAMARALYRFWFVDFDPVHAKAEGRAHAHMDAATAALFPDRFGEDGLPEGWGATTIGEVSEIVGGATPKSNEPAYWEGGDHLWATPKDLASLGQPVLFDTSRKITDAGLAKISSRLSPSGTLLLSSRAPIGYLAIAARPLAINQGFIAIRETEELSGLEAYFWCVENMELIHANANGSTFQEISKKNFRPMEYALAPKPIRDAFNDQAGELFKRLSLLCEESQTLATLRDTLLPRLMSGEVRIEEARQRAMDVA